MIRNVRFKMKSQDEVEYQIKSGPDFNWYYKALFILLSTDHYVSFSVPCCNEASSLSVYRYTKKAIDTITNFCGNVSITVNQDPYKVEVVKGVPRKLRKEIYPWRKKRDNSTCANT